MSQITGGQSEASTSGNPSSSATDTTKRREYHAQRGSTRVYLLGAFERWQQFKVEHDIKTDAKVAQMLLDAFEANKSDAHTQTDVDDAETITMESLSSPSQRKRSGEYQGLASPIATSTPTKRPRPHVLSGNFPSPVSGLYDEETLTGSEDVGDITMDIGTRSIQFSIEDTLTASSGAESDDNDPDSVTIQPSQTFDELNSELDDALNVSIYGHDEDADNLFEKESDSPQPTVEVITPKKAIEMEKCIVFTDTIMSLITTLHGSVCKRQNCSRPLDYRRTYVGTCLVVMWGCQSGHVGGRWAAQPSCDNIRAGNMTLASALLLSGNSYAKVGLMFNFCNVQYFSSTLFNQYQKLYIIPAVNEFWAEHQQQLWDQKAGKEVGLSGDGRNDSPGHSAQYCTYTLGDMQDKAILEINVVDVREASGKSNNMERIGFERGMDKLLASTMVIKEVVTDGHLEIAALMKREERYRNVVHQNDVWHGGKNITKKLNAAAKVKNNEELAVWAPSVRNHFWHCSKSCNNSVKNFKDQWIGILHHVVDEHEWVLEEGDNAARCSHEPLNEEERRKPWLKKESPAHKALTKIVLDTRFMNTLGYFVNFRHTGFLESFHNNILMYAPKRHAYSYPVYKARNQLAALDFNHHRDREQATTADGQPRFGRKFSKRTRQWCLARIMVPKQYSYIPELLLKIFEKRILSEGTVNERIGLSAEDPRRIAPNIAAVPPPSVKELVDKHQSRFN